MANIKLKIKKGDLVRVIAGDDKGKEGRVLEVMPAELRAIVEGVNIITKHTKPTAASPNGGIVKKEAPLHLSNLMLVVEVSLPALDVRLTIQVSLFVSRRKPEK